MNELRKIDPSLITWMEQHRCNEESLNAAEKQLLDKLFEYVQLRDAVGYWSGTFVQSEQELVLIKHREQALMEMLEKLLL